MLTRKLFRTMGRYRAQFISMIVMIALGIGVAVARERLHALIQSGIAEADGGVAAVELD